MTQKQNGRAFLPARFGDYFFLVSGAEVEAIVVHHFGPRRHEVFHELLLGVRAGIDFRRSAQLWECEPKITLTRVPVHNKQSVATPCIFHPERAVCAKDLS